jgi:hypothetical protein
MPDTKQQTSAPEAATARPDAADLERMPVDQVLTHFEVQPDRGLSNAEAAQRRPPVVWMRRASLVNQPLATA